ncbi:MAG: NOL1/NOP2/sun family putative RNA methylase [Clostridiaceae bacterium]|nr:NOL1/NOP2/sun family putative RNA methylase [Clostridiaceae bacterium]
MKLPGFFEDNFKKLMSQQEYDKFIDSFDEPRNSGFRVNTLKTSVDECLNVLNIDPDPIPWEPQGFYYHVKEISLGKHPLYHAGLYYIQEPSAMMPANALMPKPGEKVLDLCAAPGGKTVQIGNKMNNQGLLVTNDISPKRVKALVKNVELMGLSNTFVVNESPKRLAEIYPEFFDRILLDVPCSGEGMFRKDREAVRSYNKFKSEECVVLQREIFDSAFAMLKPGGVIVYSTCTFNPDENERNIEYFINKYDLEVDKIEPVGGFEPARAEWTLLTLSQSVSGGVRLWPHKARGEGHFVCRLIKKGIRSQNKIQTDTKGYTSKEAEKAAKAFYSFAEENLNGFKDGIFHLKGSGLYLLPDYMKDVPEVKWNKAGLFLGEYQKGRFVPSASLVMALKIENFKRVAEFSKDDHNIIRYLKGETLIKEGEKGYTVVCLEKFPLGWVKQTGGTLKNMYPKGWRMM